MARFDSNVSSADFDSALVGGLKFYRGEWVSDEQKQELVAQLDDELVKYSGEAKTAADEAKQSAQNAANSASSVQGSVDRAESFATQAQTAKSGAETARAGAEAAQTAAESAAATSAQEAASAAVQNVDLQMRGYVSAAESAKNDAERAASTAATDAVAEVDIEMAQYVSDAQAAQRAAEAAKDEAQNIVGGDFATKTEAQTYANTAESNANAYTNQQIAAIPTPDVSGPIAAHNADTAAHSDIRTAVSDAQTAATNAASAASTAQSTAEAAQTAANGKMATDFSNASAVLAAAKGGTGVTSLSALATALGVNGAAKIETRSRTGTGTCGSANPTSITFSFAPQIVFYVCSKDGSKLSAAIADKATYTKTISALGTAMLTTSYQSGVGLGTDFTESGTQLYAKKSSDGKTIYWYSSNSNAGNAIDAQLNKSGVVYYFVGIG